MGDHRGHHLLGLFLAFRLGRDLQQAIALLGVRRHGRIGHGIHLLAEDLIDSTLPHPENTDRVGDDLLLGELFQIGQGACPEHRDALVRRTRDHDNNRPVLLKGTAGRRTPKVVENRGPLGDQGLRKIVRRKLLSAADVLVERGFLLRALHERQAEGLGEDLLGQIVAGGAEAAGGDDHIGSLPGNGHAVAQTLRIIPHHGMIAHVHPDLREHFGDIAGVGIRDMPEQQFRPDGEDLGII